MTMPKKAWVKPEKRIRIGINATPGELETIDKNAAAAGLERAVYLRCMGLGKPLSSAPRIASLDEARFARLLGALHDVGSRLDRLTELIEADEPVHAETLRTMLSQLRYVLDAIGVALGVKA